MFYNNKERLELTRLSELFSFYFTVIVELIITNMISDKAQNPEAWWIKPSILRTLFKLLDNGIIYTFKPTNFIKT